MPITKEFTIRLEDRPGTLGRLFQALAEQDINILAYQQFPNEKGKSSVRRVVDNPDKTKATLDRQRNDYTEAEPGANASFLILGAADAGKAVKLLEQAAAASATT